VSAECPPAGVYRPRNPRATPLYRLVEAYYDEVKGRWEECFEERYGFWRGFVDAVVDRYLDCGRFEAGFARVRCPECAAEFLVACSCKGRGFCRPITRRTRTEIFSMRLTVTRNRDGSSTQTRLIADVEPPVSFENENEVLRSLWFWTSLRCDFRNETPS